MAGVASSSAGTLAGSRSGNPKHLGAWTQIHTQGDGWRKQPKDYTQEKKAYLYRKYKSQWFSDH